MPIPLLPATVAVVAALAAWRYKRKRGMTPQRRIIYESALKLVKDPAELRELAKTFASEGLRAEADMLNKRAALRELPESVKIARRQAFKDGMASKNPVAVGKLADAFEKQGAVGAAANLRKYAAGLVAGGITQSTPSKEVVSPQSVQAVQQAVQAIQTPPLEPAPPGVTPGVSSPTPDEKLATETEAVEQAVT